jgi:ribosome-associated translation inhibitor RaiA
MKPAVQITFRGVNPSEFVDEAIRERAERLAQHCAGITRCHVVVDQPHKHQRKGNHFSVRLDMATPYGELAVTREPHKDATHQDFRAVIRDVFDAATRLLDHEAGRHSRIGA